ncbi:PAAR/RHS domain-containing protein [Massilia violaceinigra]|uniref:PAAR/RHS domain-containing protein n=1 Tax=Massilia violaceinigra TaxID=2045208 RepID=A0ABY4A8X4_9BURK|nr:RHS repeat-associated core domain-containing protein [Massilia violaceinigra]UOD30119.1 PAAR/RHS domain-containing protein [Massilia violaceinigra]
MCPAAARLHDPIAHTSLIGMIAKMGSSLVVSVLVGAALTARVMLVVGLVVTGPVGWVAALAINLAVGFAVSLALEASGANAFIDRGVSHAVDSFIPKSIEGMIASGSRNVLTNSRPAARAASPGSHDQITCAKHGAGPPPMLAQGSDNVYINDQPAARKGDMSTCGGTIADGSCDVFIGGGTKTVRAIKDERPWYVAAAGVAIGVALTLCGKGRINLSALKSAWPCLAGIGASMLGSAAGHAIRTTMGHPVNVITGGKILREEPDFILAGPLPIAWERFYSSHDRRDGGLLGVGWSLPCEVQLTVERDAQGAVSALHYCDDQGRGMTFPPVAPGECHFSTAEGYYLIRTRLGQYLVQGIDGIFRDFGVPGAGHAGILRLQRLEDRNGNWQAFRYDAAGRLYEINDGCGRSLEIVHDAIHPLRVAEVRLAKGADGEVPGTLVRYRYTAQGELAHVLERSGRACRQFGYRHGLMSEHRVPAGLRCQYEWSGEGAAARVIRHWTDDGEAYRFDYDLAARRTTVTDQTGRVYHWAWSDDKQPTAYTDPEGHVWRYDWDQNRQLLALTDPAGAVTRWEYDEAGRLSATINALDQIEETEWDADLDLPTADTDAAGNRWAYRYDERGNLLTVTDPEGYDTEQFYDSRGLPHTVRDARGGYQHMEWNLRAQMVAYVDCSGKRTSIGYDARGELARLTDALGNATLYRHDAAGRVEAIERADGGVETFTYDQCGRMDASIDAAGYRTGYQRNARGQLLRRTDALGRTVHFAYDSAHRLERLTNENGEAYRFVYDRNDNVVEEIGLDGVVRRIAHDARGLPVSVTDAVGEADALTLRMQRDALGRLSAKHARGRSTGYRYDQAGQLLQAQQYTDHGGARTIHDDLQFAYSKRGEVLSETGHMGSLSHQYDELGNRVATTLPDGRVINSLYYGSGHLHQINIDGAIVSDMERDDLHREVARSQGQLSTRFDYNSLGRKSGEQTTRAMSAAPVLRKEWLYDAAGEVRQKRHSRHGVTQFAYDPLGRIKSSVSEARRELFNWDAAANLVDSSGPGGYVRHNRLLVFEDKRFDYDVHGRLERKCTGAHTEQHFRYDGEHRLREVDTVRAGVRQLVYFDYDALGRRIRKTDAFGSTAFLWDGLQMMQEQRGSNVATYVYEPDSYVPLARIDSVARGTDTRTAVSDDGPIGPSSRDDGAACMYYFHNDVSGLPEELTGPAGEIAWQAQYKIWGNTVSESWMQARQDSTASAAEPLPQNLRFQGQYLDRETGLHYNTFRFYDPDTGRFVSPDPIGLSGGINLQRYSPNPISWIDPLGWACWGTERKNFWKIEANTNPAPYSAYNVSRMKVGLAPQLKVKVTKGGNTVTKVVSMELHHGKIPQRVGGSGVHSANNLQKLRPWDHEAVDPFRKTGEKLLKVIKDIDKWKP